MTSLPPTPARRAVLGALALGSVGSLAGCSIRLERGAPAIPGIKTQSPPADTAAFSAALAASQGLTAIAMTAAAPWGSRLTTMHREQATRLVRVMASDGIKPAQSTSSSTSAPSAGSTAALGMAELAAVNPTALQYARVSDPANTSMFCSLLASHVAAASVLGPSPNWHGLLPDLQLALALVPATRRAVYALEVIAAQTPLQERPLVSSAVVTLAATRSRLEAVAGGKAPPAPLSYQLPITPTDAASRSALGRSVLTDLTKTAARATASNHRSVDEVRALVREWGEFTALGWQWGVPMTAFPGLTA